MQGPGRGKRPRVGGPGLTTTAPSRAACGLAGMRTKVREILQTEDDLTEIVQLVGKDSLAESDKLVLEVAKILKDDFLAQNGFSTYDRTCPFYKTVWMIRNITAFYTLAQKSIESATMEKKITMNTIKDAMGGSNGVLYKISSMKFKEPSDGEEAVKDHMRKLNEEITAAFRALNE